MRKGSWVDGDEYRAPDLGTCCACEQTGTDANPVRNIMLLGKLSPLPGKGWGCLECNLPLDGATAVLCDACLESKATIKFACSGWPGVDGRVPVDALEGEHRHNDILHLIQDPAYQDVWNRQGEGPSV